MNMIQKTSLENFMKFALALENGVNVRYIQKKTDFTYSYCFFYIREFEKLGMIETKKHGRDRIVYVTELGNELILTVKRLKDLLSR